MFSDLVPTVDIACILLCIALTLNPEGSLRIPENLETTPKNSESTNKQTNKQTDKQTNANKKKQNEGWNQA